MASDALGVARLEFARLHAAKGRENASEAVASHGCARTPSIGRLRRTALTRDSLESAAALVASAENSACPRGAGLTR